MQSPQDNGQSSISVRDMFFSCLSRWTWFVLSLAVMMTLSYLYIKKTPPNYLRTTRILLLNCGSTDNNYADIDLEALGLQSPNTSLKNEMEMLQSPVVMEQVVRTLNLDVEYCAPGHFHDKLLYGPEVPVTVLFVDEINVDRQFKIRLDGEEGVTISEFDNANNGLEVKGKLGEMVSTPCGNLVVRKSATYDYVKSIVPVVKVKKMSVEGAANAILGRMSVENRDDKSSVVRVSILDLSIARADDILNNLMLAYDENWKKTQNRIVENTAKFLEERVTELGSELGEVDDDIASYKGQHLIPNVAVAQDMYMSANNSISKDIEEYKTQLLLLENLKNNLVSGMNEDKPLSVDFGNENSYISTQVENYNKLIAQRSEIVEHGSKEHPQARDIERQMEQTRKGIVESIEQTEKSIKVQIESLRQIAGITASKIASSTQQEKHLLATERQQKVKEQLYLFLLQEKEKAYMSLNHSISNIRVIQEAGGSMAPVSPLKTQIFILAFLLGLGIPFVVIFVIEITDTQVRSRKDIDKLSVPFLGELPEVEMDENKGILSFLRIKKNNKRHTDHLPILVAENKHDVINEGLRMVRTNLEFMMRRDTSHKVISFTSANPSSGKSFISANLATSMALVGKKVLLVDLDMRRCTVSSLVSSKENGLSKYLARYTDDIDEIICHDTTRPGVDLIPVGPIPPNPTELLHDERLTELMEELRKRYDCIFLDCPPIDIVADVDIVNRYSDLTIFVIRAGLFEKNWIGEIEKIYEGKRFNNLCSILNGTEVRRGYARYGKYGYGKYGYSYGRYYTSEK